MSKHQVARSRRTRGLLASFVAVAFGFTGLVALATSSSASASTASATSIAECVPQEAWTETIPAVGTPTIEIDNPDYVQAWTEAVDHPAVTHVEYKWKSWNWSTFDYDYQWATTDPGRWWEPVYEHGWPLVQKSRVVVDTEAWTEYIEHPAVGTPKITVPNPDYVPEQIIEHQAVVCPTIVWQWHTWQTSLKDGVITPLNGGHVTWPQSYVGAGKLTPPCGVWYQQDLYKGTSDAIAALYADDELVILPNGKYEDHALVRDWKFVYGGDCTEEQPGDVPVDPAVFTAPTCDAPGTLEGVDTDDYEWIRTGPDTAAVLTATAIGEVTLTGQKVYGPRDLTMLTGEVCLSETPLIPQAPVDPPVVTQQTLAETGFPLLGALGLAGSFSLIGGGLVNARRLLRKSA
jgi:hypothetical protein